MKWKLAFLTAFCCCAVNFSSAEYSFSDKGTWPETWPKELEPLRKQSRTFEGPRVPFLHYQIPFTKRDEFEAAWPHLLKVKSKKAPLVLIRAPYTRLGRIDAGVFIHTPPRENLAEPGSDNPRTEPAQKIRYATETYIELIVDGEIVDLNRIRLPADTVIIDQRFDPPTPAVK